MRYTPSGIRMWSRLGPSGALGDAALELGKTEERVAFVSADMTFAAGLERFGRKYPDRHFETGIAEQNLVGVAAGLASEGLVPFAVTYASFLAARALDQVKLCLGYMGQNVKLIGLNAGLAAGILGATHLAIEDVSALRAVPGLTILSPADTMETVKAVLTAAETDGPVFLRLTGEMNQPMVYQEDYEFCIGKAIELRDGADVGVIASGAMVGRCLAAAEELSREQIECSVVDMHTIKPLDVEALEKLMDRSLIVTAEEHNIYGGLGSAVAEYLSGRKNAPRLIRLGVKDYYPHAAGYGMLLRECGLDVEGVVSSIRDAVAGSHGTDNGLENHPDREDNRRRIGGAE